jgi:catechol 2,3-dioxygenase-like lactoylglutathione lyase family enzyme
VAIALTDLRYVRLGTRDVGAAATFATDVLGLQLAGEDSGSIYLRSDDRDHTLVYTPGDPAEHTVGFELAGGAALEAAAAALDSAGHAVRRGTAAECEQRRVGAFVTFREPSGTNIDLVVRPWNSGRRYVAARDAGIGFVKSGPGNAGSFDGPPAVIASAFPAPACSINHQVEKRRCAPARPRHPSPPYPPDASRAPTA